MTRSLSAMSPFHRSGPVFHSSVGVHRLAWLTLALLVTLAIANLAVAQESVGSDSQTDTGAAPEDIDSEDPWADVEEMRVTGPAASDPLTSSTESVTRFDSDLLQALGAGDISDLAKITPNLEIRTAGATAPTFFIRGVGLSDFNANAGGAVAIYQDDVAMNLPGLQLGQLFDVANVEVLRGPQGAGAGRNASAGAIKVTSVKPLNDGESRAFMLASYGNYNALNLEGALEVPILQETLAARFSFTFNERDGWGENGCGNLPSITSRLMSASPRPPKNTLCGDVPNLTLDNPNSPGEELTVSSVPAGLATTVNDIGNWAARGMFRLLPESNESDWLLILRGGRIDQQSGLGQTIGTSPQFGSGQTSTRYKDPDIQSLQVRLIDECELAGGTGCVPSTRPALRAELARNLDPRPRRGDYNRVGQTQQDTWGVSLEGEIPVGDLTITTISAYDGYDRFREQDDDFTPDVIFESITEDDAWQFSQAIHLEGEFEEQLISWEAGAYTLIEQLGLESTFFQGDGAPSNQAYQQEMYSFGVYAGFSWEFAESLTLEAGARYNWEQKDFQFQFLGSSPENTQSFTERRTWQAPTGTVRLLYEPTEDLSFYWKYSRGWKGGQFNASATQLNARPAEPESIDAFEVGLSAYLWENRLGLTASLFYYMYDDYQVFVVEDSPGAFPQEIIINANSAQNYGAEMEARISPLLSLVPEEVENLLLTVRFGWLKSEFLDFTQDVVRKVGRRPADFFPVTVDFSGNQLINAPEYKVSLGAEWEFQLGKFGDVTPRYDGSWSADVNFGPNGGRGSVDANGQPRLPEYAIGQRAFWLHNVSFRYRPPISNVEIMGWVRNVTDQTYKTFAFDGSFFANLTVNWVGEPRTYGGTVRFAF